MTTERKNLTQPSDWWAAFADQAAQDNVSLSEWVGECCRAAVDTRTRQRLSDRPSVGAPKQSPRAKQ